MSSRREQPVERCASMTETASSLAGLAPARSVSWNPSISGDLRRNVSRRTDVGFCPGVAPSDASGQHSSRRATGDRWTRVCFGAGGHTMIGLLRAITIILLVVAGMPSGRAQTPPSAPCSQAILDEADRLNGEDLKLYEQGKYAEAVVP